MDKIVAQGDELLFQQIGPYTPCLPPGTENMGLPVYGVLELNIGKLIDMDTTTNPNNIKIKPVFWGENSASLLLKASNTCMSDFEAVQTNSLYAIR